MHVVCIYVRKVSHPANCLRHMSQRCVVTLGTLLVLLLLVICVRASSRSIDDAQQSPRRGTLRLLLQHGGSSSFEFAGLPLPHILESPMPAQTLADLMGLSLEELFTLNAMTGSAGDLPAGLAVQALGRPAVPPLPTTVKVDDAEQLAAFCNAYGIAIADMQQVCAMVHLHPDTLTFTKQANPLLPLPHLAGPATLSVPLPAHHQSLPACPSSAAACARPGETLVALATRIGCDADALLAANPQLGPRHQRGTLYLGQAVRDCTAHSKELATVQVHMQPADSLYEHLLAVAGVPITADYLARLATANRVGSADDLVRLLPVDRDVELIDPEAPVDDEDEDEVLDDAAILARRRLMLAPSTASPARLPFSMGRQLLQTYRPRRSLEERAAPLLSMLHFGSRPGMPAQQRAKADKTLEQAVADGDADAVLQALQAGQEEEEEDDEVVSVAGGEASAEIRRSVLARRLLSIDGNTPQALLAALTPRSRGQ